MKINRIALLLTVLSAGGLSGETRYILETKAAADEQKLASRYGFTILRTIARSGGEASYTITAARPLSAVAMNALKAEAGVRGLEADVEVHAAEATPGSRAAMMLDPLAEALTGSAPTDFAGVRVRSGYVNQRTSGVIELAAAHARFGTGEGVTVAIIDTGVDPNHPVLRNVLIPGYDFTRDRAGTASELADLDQSTVAILDQSTVAILDSKRFPVRLNQSTVAILDQSTVAILDGTKLPSSFGHGTMVAGLVHLVAPRARIMPLKAFRADGSSSLSNIVTAIRYAADHGVDVISMSFSLRNRSTELQDAIAYAVSKGAVCVAASGNEGREGAVFPASLPRVIGVGSTNDSDRRSPFSNFGAAARTSAPGEALVTTYPGNNYAGVWGTSFSTGLVSGAAALLRDARPGRGFDFMMDALDAGPRIGQDMGDARLDLVKSLNYCARAGK